VAGSRGLKGAYRQAWKGAIVRRRPRLSAPVENLRDLQLGLGREGRVACEVARLALTVGQQVRQERVRRHLTLAQIAGHAGLGVATVQGVELGRPASLDTYARLAGALRLRLALEFMEPRGRDRPRRAADPVHAAMGEIEAEHLRRAGFAVNIDEPYQHFQFAGRADVVAWSVERAALLHLENRTEFPDIQDSIGAFNAKRRYLGEELAARAGVTRWRSETHVIVGLWSADVLRALRAHESTFGAVCPGDVCAFESWWSGEPPPTGRCSSLIVFDPAVGRRSDRRRWVGLADVARARPRYRCYAEAARSLALKQP
jgi:transcriptional regulator with XRE-family HTH domain